VKYWYETQLKDSPRPLTKTLQSRQLPHAKLHIIDAALKVRDEGLTPPIPTWAPTWLQELMRKMWSFNPEERPTIQEVVAVLEKNVP